MNLRWLDRRIAAPGPYLALCLTEKLFHDACRKLNLPNMPWVSNAQSDATTHHLHNDAGQRVCVICVRGWEGRDPVEIAGLLVHEAVHVWQEYCDQIGERDPGREQEAYAIQNIAQELMTEFRKQSAELCP